jgi:hypothetical protein
VTNQRKVEDTVESQMAAAARRETRTALAEGASCEPLLAELLDRVDVFAAGSMLAIGRLRPASRPVACAKGCSYCCYLLVGTSIPEVLVVADHLRQTRDAEAFAAVRRRVAAADDASHGADACDRLLKRTPCPLLVDGACSVYPARPLICRGYISYSWAACVDWGRRFRQFKNMPLDHPRRALYGAASQGIIDGHVDLGLPGGAVELIAALRIALETPDAQTRWLAGEDVFAAAAEIDEPQWKASMKVSIDQRIYDTEKGETVAEAAYGTPGTDDYQKESLCRTDDGVFFLAGAGGPGSYYSRLFAGRYVPGEDVIPLTAGQARRWLEDHVETDAILRLFGDGSTGEAMRIELALPSELAGPARRVAADANLAVEDWLTQLVRQAVAGSAADD